MIFQIHHEIAQKEYIPVKTLREDITFVSLYRPGNKISFRIYYFSIVIFTVCIILYIKRPSLCISQYAPHTNDDDERKCSYYV